MSDDAKILHDTFATPTGQKALAWMRRMTIDRQLAADVPEAVLRDIEGQRRLVRLIESNIKAAKEGYV